VALRCSIDDLTAFRSQAQRSAWRQLGIVLPLFSSLLFSDFCGSHTPGALCYPSVLSISAARAHFVLICPLPFNSSRTRLFPLQCASPPRYRFL
jgi:hypothetical protein